MFVVFGFVLLVLGFVIFRLKKPADLLSCGEAYVSLYQSSKMHGLTIMICGFLIALIGPFI